MDVLYSELDLTETHTERFLQSKDWQQEFNNLSGTELKIAAIFTILNCPNCTCRKNLLFKRVLYFLKVRTNQGPKQKFKQTFNRILNQLISVRVFREYNKNKPHPRVKYDRVANMEYLDSLLKKLYKIEPTDEKLARLKDVYNQSHPLRSGNMQFPSNSLFSSNEEDEQNSESEIVIVGEIETQEEMEILENGLEEMEDDEAENSLDKFIDDDIPDLDTPPYSITPISINSSEIKEFIKSYFGRIPNVTVEEPYPELKLSFKNHPVDFFILIDINILQKEIFLKVMIDFYEQASVDLLKLWAKLNYNAAICIDEYGLKDHFVIKRKIDLKRYSKEEMISLVDDMIRAARQTCITIEKHL